MLNCRSVVWLPIMLDVRHLDFDYPDKPLLKNISFFLAESQLLHLQGENGKGKTTLLRILAGLLQPTAGEVFCTEEALSYIGHKTGVSALLTPREHWRLELLQNKDKAAFEAVSQQLGLLGMEDTLCGLLSAGQRRRVGLMRLLISRAKLWLLDEPFSALDVQTVFVLKTIIEKHLAERGSVILTSHQTLPFDHASYMAYRL